MSRQIVVVGGGIVGASLAASLAEHGRLGVTVLERGPRDRLLGSSGHAPGFVGWLGATPVMTELARASANAYEALEHGGRNGFDRVGGVEVAFTSAALRHLERRAALAHEAGLPAQVLDRAHAVALAPELVDRQRCVGAVLYPQDGTARADVITAAFRQRAERAGARFAYDAPVSAIDTRANRVVAVRTGGQTLPADDVVLACGIWGPRVASLVGQDMPLIPVAHPYVYGPPHDRPAPRRPFVRWPEHNVYARDHGDQLGLGTYDHTPCPVAIGQLGQEAIQPWPATAFEPAVQRALELLPREHRFRPEQRLCGLYSITADDLPLVGAVEDIEGLWMAEALWITHAAGAAHGLAQLMTDSTPDIDRLDALSPSRLRSQDPAELTERALSMYGGMYSAA